MSDSDRFALIVIVVALSAVMLLGLLVLAWLNVSRTKLGQKFRGPDTSEKFPHMHVVNGVVVTHSHPAGDREHDHSEVTVPMEHYADLVKQAQDSSPASPPK